MTVESSMMQIVKMCHVFMENSAWERG